MNCLLTFVLCCAMNVVLDVILNGVLQQIFAEFGSLIDGRTSHNATVAFATLIYLLSATCALVSQSVGAWYGWKAYQEARSVGTSQVPGSWAEEQQQGRQQAPNNSTAAGGNGLWGGGWVGGEGAGAARPGQQGFQVFQGSGNRLGGD